MNVVLKLSKLCNLRCAYCYEYEQLGDRARMPLDGLGFFFHGLARHYRAARWGHPLRFAFHGGEPLLLPSEYLRSVVELQRRHLGASDIPFSNSVQTNLYRVRPDRLALLEELGIRLGVSFDLHGRERVDASGEDASPRTGRNLQALVHDGSAQRIGTAGISVLHAGNVDRSVDTFRHFEALGLDYRILPIFSMAEAPGRMRHLLLQPGQVVSAYQAVARARYDPGVASGTRRIRVHPLEGFLDAAVRFLVGRPAPVYDPRKVEWALIVDTNGDAYGHCEAYTPGFRFGNVFREDLADVLRSAPRERLQAERAQRATVCERCPYDGSCSRIPMVEALPSERVTDAAGQLQCAVARPMIDFMVGLIASDAGARRLVDRAHERAAPPYPA